MAVQLHPVARSLDRAGAAADVVEDWDVGEIVYVHATPACVTLKVWPPTVIAPVRTRARVGRCAVADGPLPLPRRAGRNGDPADVASGRPAAPRLRGYGRPCHHPLTSRLDESARSHRCRLRPLASP